MLLKTGDNITTDDIMPAGSKVLPFRSNIPAISDFVFSGIDSSFSSRAKEVKDKGGCIVVGGENYGQGSSREHAALAPMFLGMQTVIAKSFARIHRSNLINFGILPLVFANPGDYDSVSQGDRLRIAGILDSLGKDQVFRVENMTKGTSFEARAALNSREADLLRKGGLLPYTKSKTMA